MERMQAVRLYVRALLNCSDRVRNNPYSLANCQRRCDMTITQEQIKQPPLAYPCLFAVMVPCSIARSWRCIAWMDNNVSYLMRRAAGSHAPLPRRRVYAATSVTHGLPIPGLLSLARREEGS